MLLSLLHFPLDKGNSMCCAGVLEDGVEGGGVVVRPPPPFDAGGGGGRRTVGGGAGGGVGVVARPRAPWEEEGGVVVTPRKLKQLTPGYGKLSCSRHTVMISDFRWIVEVAQSHHSLPSFCC